MPDLINLEFWKSGILELLALANVEFWNYLPLDLPRLIIFGIPDLRGLIFPEFQLTRIPDYAIWNHIPDSTIRNFGIIISCFLDQ